MVHLLTDIVVSSDGGTLCIPAHAEAALGGVPVQVLRRERLSLHSFLLRYYPQAGGGDGLVVSTS